ncbi:MAG: hypothetical protein AMK69_12975 [Nitrospira bacterium SG8_3]|nr:MAG: hypothetical protein AMK69_12975 [Nitrospira bacterium SG8_3]
MAKVLWGEVTAKAVNPLRQVSSGRIQRQCNSCGLEWDSAHDEETCPLRELEAVFLPEDWFYGSQ